MAKYGVYRHALAIIMIVAAIIYSTIAADDSHESAVTKQKSRKNQHIDYGFPKYHHAFNLDICFKNCFKKFEKEEIRFLVRCNAKCELLKKCIDECTEMYADAYRRQNCYKGCKFINRGPHRIGEIENPWLRK
ncbi:hypothetical protein PIB30_076758 [Stylosanthes scabra]|uniref:Uncharacterized protein n=1 Tax=Stylosanthes scabra TaxID=79078 RepID=A0ABU6YMY2_9FABA|nr:hypothetical protein [Stylosanthes scabra]